VGKCEQSRPVSGIAVLDGQLFVCSSDSNCYEVYDATTLSLVKRRTIRQLNGALDLTICRTHRCIYIADKTDKTVHRVSLTASEELDGATMWSVACSPSGLSATPPGKVLVTFRHQPVLHEYSTNGDLIREIPARRNDLGFPIYAVQIAHDRFGAIFRAACDGQDGRTTMCVIDDCGRVLHSYSGYGRTNWWSVRKTDGYVHLVADGMMITVDADNGRVLMMDPRLNGESNELIAGLKDPVRLAFDTDLGKVYVTVTGDDTADTICVYQLL